MMKIFSSSGSVKGRWLRLRKRLVYSLLTGALVAAGALAVASSTPVRLAELKAFDARSQLLADPSRADSSIVLVTIDDLSLDLLRHEFGRWPWSREAHAYLVDYLSAAGAGLIVYDVSFSEPQIEAPQHDEAFAESIRESGIVVLPVDFGLADPEHVERLEEILDRAAGQQLLQRFALARPDSIPEDMSFQRATLPLDAFSAGVKALGCFRFNPDEDGVSRRERLLYGYRGAIYPSLALAAAVAGAPDRFQGDVSVDEDRLRIGTESIPLHQGRFLIRWHGSFLGDGRNTYATYPIYEVLNSYQQIVTGLEPDVPLEAFRDKIVMVGLTGVGLLDARPTPLEPLDPGLMIHATLLDNLLQGEYLRRAPAWLNGAKTAAAAIATAVLVGAVGSAVLASLAGLLVLVVVVVVGVGSFSNGLWVDMALPLFAVGLAYAATMGVNYVTEGRDRRRIREMFSRYVSPEYVRRLADDHQSLRLGGERVELSILFSDIRGFTSLSERLPAEAVIELLNSYLDRMAEVVFRHGGTLDKFIGDAVMAFWGAPLSTDDHARKAVDAALEMLAEVEALNRQLAEEGESVSLSIGIGVHTGEAIVGNIGSLSHKLDYTAIGDPVNLASRLEGLNKEYGTSLIVSHTSFQGLDSTYHSRELGEVNVKGKERPVRIFELTGRKDPPPGAMTGITALLVGGALVLLGSVAETVHAQQPEPVRARWIDWIYRPGAWQGGSVSAYTTRDPATDSLALVARADAYSLPPRWRVELRKIRGDGDLGDPIVLVGEKDEVVVLTALGATALHEHTAADDTVVQAVVRRFDDQGRPTLHLGRRAVDRGQDDRVELITLRQVRILADFPDHLLETGRASRLGRQLLQASVHQLGDTRQREVAASAGVRGVVRVQTVDGEVEIMPDTVAVQRLEEVRIGILDLDRFLREGRLGSHTERPRKEELP